MSPHLPCPGCREPAHVTDRFTLPSTDGPIEHIAVECVANHHYRMPVDMLDRTIEHREPRITTRPLENSHRTGSSVTEAP